MKSVKIDRETATELLPIFMNKGIYKDYENLPKYSEILQEEAKRLNTLKLTTEQQREVLTKVGTYRTPDYVVRDYGDYLIAFGMNGLNQGGVNSSLFDPATEIKRVRLYKLGYIVAYYILSEVFKQKRYEDIVIEKKKIISDLGYSTNDKQIYNDISDVMFSLAHLNYVIIRFKKKGELYKMSSQKLGYFIYDLEDNLHDKYIISVNKHYVGCVLHFFAKAYSKKVPRGYFNFPIALIPEMKKYSSSALLLLTFLLASAGNHKLNTSEYKVIAVGNKYLSEELNIKHMTYYDIKERIISALEQIGIIENIEPALEDLKQLKPAEFMQQVLRIYLPKSINRLDDLIQSNLLGVKTG